MKSKGCILEHANLTGEYLDDLVGKICDTYQDSKGINHIEGHNLPRQQEILDVLDKLMEIIFPGSAAWATTVSKLSLIISATSSRMYIANWWGRWFVRSSTAAQKKTVKTAR